MKADFLKQLQMRLANVFSGQIIVQAKVLLNKFGKDHVEDAIEVTHDLWNAIAEVVNLPLVEGDDEKKIEQQAWAQIELQLRAYAKDIFGYEKPVDPPKPIGTVPDKETAPSGSSELDQLEAVPEKKPRHHHR